MAEEKKTTSRRGKKPAAPKSEAPKVEQAQAPEVVEDKKVAVKKPSKQKSSCRHLVHEHLGKGEIIEELVVNNKPSYRIKFENLTKTIVFKKENIIKE
jgi:hypothetical protein